MEPNDMHGGTLELALVFLLAAVVAVPVFKRFGLGAVLGYLVAGVLLGPHELALVRDPERVLAASTGSGLRTSRSACGPSSAPATR